MEQVKQKPYSAPILFPYEPDLFWNEIRKIIREEISALNTRETKNISSPSGHGYKPLYKIDELCTLFSVTKPTIYQWIRSGILQPFKIQSRVYFLWEHVSELLKIKNSEK